ncbi:MAG: D-2-hydroxyacid dehydrogenase [Bacteroidota bacterium]
MTIVVLDGFTLNPGDLSWRALQDLGECQIYDRTPVEEIVPRASGAEIVLTNKTPLSGETIAGLPLLRYIGVLATGHNIVDSDATHQRGIPVSNVPAYGTASVTQMVFAHILNLTMHVAPHAESVRSGKWTRSPDFCFREFPLVELSGLTLGIIGFGRIGSATAKVGISFGMNLIAYDKDSTTIDAPGVQSVGLDEVFRRSDIVSLHCPLTAENRGLVNDTRLQMMKPTSLLINTSRGPLVDEAALARALFSGTIAGAGLDVLSIEPPPTDNPLLTAPNCVITPHIAWATQSARQRLLSTVVQNVKAFLEGSPINVVNG